MTYSRSTLAEISAQSAKRGDVVRHDGGSYEFIGQVAEVFEPYCLIIDCNGRLCRAVWPGTIQVLGESIPGHALAIHEDLKDLSWIKIDTDRLLGRVAVREALIIAQGSPADQMAIDLWNLHLHRIAGSVSLKPLARAYYGWEANTRRRFERAIALLDKPESFQQYSVLMDVVLGRKTVMDMSLETETTEANIRLAKMRAMRRIRSRMGSIVDA